MSKSRDALYEAVYELVYNEDRGMKPGAREQIAKRAQSALRKLMYGRKMNGWYDGLPKEAYRKEVFHVVEQMMDQIRRELEEEVTCGYTRNIDEGLNLGFITWYGDDGVEEQPEFEAEFDGFEPDDELLRMSCVDYERSDKFLREILEEMDPDGTDVAQYPNECVSRSIPESLFYLTGKNGKEGILSCDWVSSEVRSILWDFVKASWKHYKAQKQQALEANFFC